MAVVNVRTDRATDVALAQLTADATSRSEAIRRAILDAAREATRRPMREDADRLRNDPDDLAEVRRVHEIMDSLRAW